MELRPFTKEEQQFDKEPESMSIKELDKLIAEVKKKMEKAAAELNFIYF